MTVEMEDPVIVALIDRWIADYYSRFAWKQFEKDGCVLSPWLRDYILLQKRIGYHIIAHEALADKEVTLTPEIDPWLLIDFMYKVSIGEKLFEDVDKSRDILLEEAIEILDRLCSVGKLNDRLGRDSILHLKLLLRQQAVLVCCKKNEFDLAKKVFGRQWRHWKNENEMDVRQQLFEVIEKQNCNHRYFDLMPYSSLIEGSRTLLHEIFSLLKTPFLVTAAQNVCSKFSSKIQKYSLVKCQNLSNDVNQISNYSNPNIGTCSSTPTTYNIKPNQMEDIRSIETETGVCSFTAVVPEQISSSELTVSAVKPEQISDSEITFSAVKPEQIFCSEVTVSAIKPEHISNSQMTVSADTLKSESLQMNSLQTVAECSKAVGKSVRKLKDECSNTSQTDNESDSPNETSNLKQEHVDVKLECLDWEAELSGAVLPSTESRSRKPWQPKEEERLYVGVQKYGVGQWRKVADFLGSNRSNVDVKDKWRTMTKQGKLKTYEKRFGPIVTYR